MAQRPVVSLSKSAALDSSTAERVARELRAEILSGHLISGDRLKDTDLAVRFDVSRNTLRDALRLLGADGLVSTRLNAGSTVRQLSEDDARDIYTVRRTIEGAAVLASSRASDERFRAIATALDTATVALQEDRWQDLGTSSLVFHQSIVALLGSERLDDFFSNIIAQLRLVFAVMTDESEFQLQWVERDRQIAALIVSGQRAESAAALATYLDESEQLVVDAIRASRHRPAELRRARAVMPRTPNEGEK
jgi:DNA-binding GntR family transcriptional regulator